MPEFTVPQLLALAKDALSNRPKMYKKGGSVAHKGVNITHLELSPQAINGGAVFHPQHFDDGGGVNPLQPSFEAENRPGVIVSPRPGKGGGPPIAPEAGMDYQRGLHDDRPEWSPATPNLLGTALPPPVQHPVFNQPRMNKLVEHTAKMFKDKNFNDVVHQVTGLRGLTIKPTVGTWNGEMEPSFLVHHSDMTHDQAHKLANLLGFGFQQDATVHVHHNPNAADDGIPALLIGNGKKLSQKHIDAIHAASKPHGLDFTVTGDGKAAKFLHFGGDDSYDDFLHRVNSVADQTKMNHKYHAKSLGDLINAENYLPNIFGTESGETGVQTGPARSPDLFGKIVDHVLAPYAKAVAGEGYRLSPERLAETYGLTGDEAEKVRQSLYPTGKKSEDRTTVPLMTGQEQLDVRPTGHGDKNTVGDVLYALQNRAASKGQIDPGDFSDEAKNKIANDIAREVQYHVATSDKSAIGWYDAALKKAMNQYAQIFPELKTDKDKEMLFHAILGITSQGNDVFSNSVHAARLYNLVRDGGMELPDAINKMKGTFGDKTRAIETNLHKFNHLVSENGYDTMRGLFNQKKTVSEWNKILRENDMFQMPDGERLKMQGGKDQKVTGWMVFGPKIGSFINNLHGDYSTLTADLWFSRTWNRLLGHNFIHAPLAEQKQYQDFKDAFKAEFMHNNAYPWEQRIPYKTSEGQFKGAEGKREDWLHGNDTKELNWDDYHRMLDDPDAMLDYAREMHDRYKGGQYKEKSDLRRRAKNWIENRELPVAAPRGDAERAFQQDTVEEAQKLLKKKFGLDISVADIQAALWFHEKELFNKLGVASEKAKPADYEDAARHTMDLINKGDLYKVKSKQKKASSGEEGEGYEQGGRIGFDIGGAVPETPTLAGVQSFFDQANLVNQQKEAAQSQAAYQQALSAQQQKDAADAAAKAAAAAPKEGFGGDVGLGGGGGGDHGEGGVGGGLGGGLAGGGERDSNNADATGQTGGNYWHGGRIHYNTGGPVNVSKAEDTAGNFKKEHEKIHGIPVAIEVKKGHERVKYQPGGKIKFKAKQYADYGAILGTKDADGMNTDVMVGPHKGSDKAYIIDQQKHDSGKFDEHKVLLGFKKRKKAIKAYTKSYADRHGKERVKDVVKTDIKGLKKWLKHGNLDKPASKDALIKTALSVVSKKT